MTDSIFNLSGKNLLAAMLVHQSSATVIAWLYEGSSNLATLILPGCVVATLRFVEARRQSVVASGAQPLPVRK